MKERNGVNPIQVSLFGAECYIVNSYNRSHIECYPDVMLENGNQPVIVDDSEKVKQIFSLFSTMDFKETDVTADCDEMFMLYLGNDCMVYVFFSDDAIFISLNDSTYGVCYNKYSMRPENQAIFDEIKTYFE